MTLKSRPIDDDDDDDADDDDDDDGNLSVEEIGIGLEERDDDPEHAQHASNPDDAHAPVVRHERDRATLPWHARVFMLGCVELEQAFALLEEEESGVHEGREHVDDR
eukprot:3925332-Rhodomonas_salina.2